MNTVHSFCCFPREGGHPERLPVNYFSCRWAVLKDDPASVVEASHIWGQNLPEKPANHWATTTRASVDHAVQLLEVSIPLYQRVVLGRLAEFIQDNRLLEVNGGEINMGDLVV